MSINLEVRINQLQSLQQYIVSSRQRINSILQHLKWNDENVVEGKQFIRCSVEHSHRIPVMSVEKHIARCALRKEGYDLNEPFLPDPMVQDDSKSLIHIDDHKKIELLSAAHKTVPNFKSAWNGQDPDPKTSSRATCSFSSDERLALYSYAIANTVGPPTPSEFVTTPNKISNDEPLTYEEKLMQERDAKRRRLKYKSVHTNRKSYTEVMREVIAGQMDNYTDWLDTQIRRWSKNKDGSERSSSIKKENCIAVHERAAKMEDRRQDNRRHPIEPTDRSPHYKRDKNKIDHRHNQRDRRRSRSRTRDRSAHRKRDDDKARHSRSSRSRSSHSSKYKDK